LSFSGGRNAKGKTFASFLKLFVTIFLHLALAFSTIVCNNHVSAKPVFGNNVFRPTVKPKRKPEKNFKFGSSLRFGPVRQRRNTVFPETYFFQKTGKILSVF
jgi:hypothetical protein